MLGINLGGPAVIFSLLASAIFTYLFFDSGGVNNLEVPNILRLAAAFTLLAVAVIKIFRTRK